MAPLRLVTWNVNGLRAVERKGALAPALASLAPDVLLLQEIKGRPEQFSDALVAHPDFRQFYHPAQRPGYAGTGVWVRRTLPCNDLTIVREVPHLVNADEGRVTEVRCVLAGCAYSFLSVYFPNGGKSPQAWKEKLIFYDQMLAYITQLHEAGRIVILGGDFNVAHTPQDLARPKANEGHIGFHPDERAWMDRLTAAGWVDVWRAQHPRAVQYTWWDQLTRARERNVGWRIDYFIVHEKHFPRVRESRIADEVMGSDHCPVLMTFAPPRC